MFGGHALGRLRICDRVEDLGISRGFPGEKIGTSGRFTGPGKSGDGPECMNFARSVPPKPGWTSTCHCHSLGHLLWCLHVNLLRSQLSPLQRHGGSRRSGYRRRIGNSDRWGHVTSKWNSRINGTRNRLSSIDRDTQPVYRTASYVVDWGRKPLGIGPLEEGEEPKPGEESGHRQLPCPDSCR